MSGASDRIEREITIAAPVERVWELITQPEHVGRWFGDAGAESGFASLQTTPEKRRAWYDDHVQGWGIELGHLDEHTRVNV